MNSAQWFSRLDAAFAGLVFCAVLLMVSCVETPTEVNQIPNQSSSKTLDGRPERFGGDQFSWITPAGDNADSSYCNARLKLPLDSEPTWEYSYTDAVFSSLPYNEIVHYDGVLAIAASSTQVMGLDSRTGELLFNEDVYYDSGNPERTKRIQALFFHPKGFLSARDIPGRLYCWDIVDGNLEESWIFPGSGGTGGVVADRSNFYACENNQVCAVDVVSGDAAKHIPTMLSATSIVMSKSGLIAYWKPFRSKLTVFDISEKQTKWINFLDDSLTSAVIDDKRERLYVTTFSETVLCLDLQTGKELWSFDFRWVLDEETRQKRANLLNISETFILPARPIVNPLGYCLPLASGDVFMLSENGKMMWHYQADSSIRTAIGFSNAILIKQMWNDDESFPVPWFDPFNLNQPDWEEINALVEFRQMNIGKENETAAGLGKFARVVALDMQNGLELDAFEPEEYTYGSFIPAYSSIVLTKVKGQRQAGSRRGLAKWIVAYNWLEEGSE